MIPIALPPAWAERASAARQAVVRHQNALFFAGGFLFDLLTLDRIDAWLDLGLQALYLSAITALIVLQSRRELGLWQPPRRLEKIWAYDVEALHFFYGGLLSAYVIFYSKSSAGAREGLFLLLMIGLMLANEMPQVRDTGTRLRLGLHAFCLASYLNYLFPVLLGRMGAGVFTLALTASALGSWALLWLLRKPNPEPGPWLRQGWPPALVLGAIAAFYALRWIPPVPLSLQYAGVFHGVDKADGDYALTYLKPPWYLPWRADDRTFLARPGDKVFCFFRVFAPRNFQHRVFLRWSVYDPARSRWLPSDRIALDIRGGRGRGFRGFASKANHHPGYWRVEVESSEGRLIGALPFELREDPGSGERVWRRRRM